LGKTFPHGTNAIASQYALILREKKTQKMDFFQILLNWRGFLWMLVSASPQKAVHAWARPGHLFGLHGKGDET
jgi:hypothetical protein